MDRHNKITQLKDKTMAIKLINLMRKPTLSSLGKFLLPSFAILSVVFSLLVRVVYRGPYYPGWDTLGQAHGLFLVSTQSFWDAFSYIFYSIRHFQCWNHTNSLLYTLIPGYLGSLWPWEYWGHLLTFILFMLTLWMIIKLIDLPIWESWIIILALGAAPSLLSFSVAGYPYVTGFLPHALALWITLDRRICKNWLLTLFFCLATNELSWHLYELGKTLFVVFIAAAILHREVPLRTRAVWILTSAIQLGMVMKYSGANVGSLLYFDQLGVHKIASNILSFSYSLFVAQMLDIPVLFVSGIISFFFFKNNRRFLLILFIVQIGLVVLLAIKGMDLVRPRRFLVVDFYCMVGIASMFRKSNMVSRFGKIPKIALICLLLVGNIWQILNLLHYIKVPIQKQRYPMPYTMSQADYLIPAPEVDWYLEMRSRVNAGEKLILIYNLSAYPENTTDPAGVLERLYLYLGHNRYRDSVFVFGSPLYLGSEPLFGTVQCRYSCVPVRPLEEIETFLDGIQQGSTISPTMVTVYYIQPQVTTYRHLFELDAAKIFEEIRNRFVIRLDSPKESKYMRFKITARESQNSSFLGFTIEPKDGGYQLNMGGFLQEKSFSWRGFPLDITWVDDPPENTPYFLKRPWEKKPFSLKLSGILHIFETGLYTFLLGSDDGAILNLNGQVVIDNSGRHIFQLVQRSLVLVRGSYPIEVTYSDGGGEAHLLLDLN